MAARSRVTGSVVAAAAALATLIAVAAPVAADPPPLPEPYSDYTINAGLGDIALCGTFHFGTLTIDSGRTLSVATLPNPSLVPVRPGEAPRARCLAGEVGSLTIIANRIVNNGTIDASGTQTNALQPEVGPGAVYTGDPASGNGGGGHAGPGGTGSLGDGGDPYASPDGTGATRGMPGAGDGGRGGGSITLIAERLPTRLDPQDPAITWIFGDIQSTGTIRANGVSAPGDTTGTCGVADDPATELNERVPFAGDHAPGGGGAGGSVVLEAERLDLSGVIQATGGDGGFGRAGGGGGGAGGIVRLEAPITRHLGGLFVNVAGGAPGGACVTGDTHPPGMPRFAGLPGGAGLRVDVTDPRGTLLAPDSFWNRTSVSLPLDAAASFPTSSPSGFTTYVCGERTAAATPTPATPASNTSADPCGSSIQLASRAYSVFAVQPTDPNGFINVTLAGAGNDGYWHLWLAVVRDEEVSPPPAASQVTIGIDNTAPTVAFTSPIDGFETFEPTIDLAFTPVDPVVFGEPSLVAQVECRNELPAVTAYAPCTGDGDFELSPGYGAKRIGVRVTDHAGNSTESSRAGSFLNSPPEVAAAAATANVDEGGTASMAGTVSDVEPVTFAASTGAVTSGPSGTWTWSRSTTDGPAESQTVTITATDELGASAQTTFALVVANVAPSGTILGPPVGSTFEVGQSVPVSASFSDPGTGDTHTASIDWGDGTTTPGALTQSAGSGSVTGGHAYAAAGTYVATITVVDDDGGSARQTRTISVRRIATSLTAEPALLRVGPGISLNFFSLRARLTRADTGAPIGGQVITMTVPRLGGGTPLVVCAGTTGADGWATCNGLASALSVTLSGYQANFAGSASHEPAQAKGGLVLVRLRLL